MKKKLSFLFILVLVLFSFTILISCSSEEEHEHEFLDEWSVKTPATTEAEGLEVNTCHICNREIERKIPKHVHSLSGESVLISAATEDTPGIKSTVCTGCGESVEEAVYFCLTHTVEGEWILEKEATLSSVGKERNVCCVCGGELVREIPRVYFAELFASKMPYTTAYFSGELFNPYGLEVKAVLSDGTELIVKDYELQTKTKLTANDKYAVVTYRDLTLEIPITVSKYVVGSVKTALDGEVGASVYVKGFCIASLQNGGEKSIVIRSLTGNDHILVSGVDYDYETGDKVAIYTTVASDEKGKYLIYAEENGNGEGTVLSKGNSLLSVADEQIVGSLMAQNVFDGELLRYSTVKLSGLFYLVKDGGDYIVHFNEAATDKNGARTSSGALIRVRDLELLESDFASALTYPGVLVSGNISALYLGDEGGAVELKALSNSQVIVDSAYNELASYAREAAYAYYYQLPYIDYDQYNARRNNNPAPEDATALHRIYLDCSSYVNAVYFSAYGKNVLPYSISNMAASTLNFTNYAKENPDGVDVVGHFRTSDYDAEESEILLASVRSQLCVGDVIVYRRDENGHTLIYVGEDKFLHCANTSYTHVSGDPLASYDYVNDTSIKLANASDLFENTESSLYLFRSTNVNITLLRPLNRGLAATEETMARMTIPSLSIEKSVDANMYSAVFFGDILTYTVTLKNNGLEDLSGVTLSEKVPFGTEFFEASDGISCADGMISWVGEVKAGDTVTLTFKVIVTATDAGTLIESNCGEVNGLDLNKITNTVSGISRDKINELISMGYAAAQNVSEYVDPIDMIKDIYSNILAGGVLSYQTVDEALSDIIDLGGNKYNVSCAAKDVVIANLSGGYEIREMNRIDNERIRDIRLEYLSVGDVIIAQYKNTGKVTVYTAYIYLGGSDFLCVTSDSGMASIVKYKESEGNIVQNILTSLYSYDKYATIRPSMANKAD